MKSGKNTIVTLVILTIIILIPSVSYAQWGELFGGFLQAVGERYIDNSNYSSQDRDNMRTVLNALSNELNTNQNARNATIDAFEGNYTGTIIQGAQAILNAAGNYQYDMYFNSANQINDANREYYQNINNGMDRNVALDERNTIIGYSAAESIIEFQDRIARERLENARQQREIERQSWESNNYNEATIYNEFDPGDAASNPNVLSGFLIAHVNTANVLDAMPDKARAEIELENYFGELQNQLQAMVTEYQAKMQNYEANQSTMSNLMKQSMEREIVDLQNRIQQFQENAESGFEAKRAELLRPILNKIQNAINMVASENELSYVIDISTGAAVFIGEDAIDITYMVMKKLGIQ